MEGRRKRRRKRRRRRRRRKRRKENDKKKSAREEESGTGVEGMSKTCHNHHAVWYTTVIFTIIFNADFKQTHNNHQ